MSKKNIHKSEKYSSKQSYENSFISDVIETYNHISQMDLDAQKEAIRNIIAHIKNAVAEGKNVEEIKDMILYNMSNLVSIIKYPNLTNFYQIRTLEYMMGLNLDPYIDELLLSNIDILEFEKKNKENYSADVEKNVMIELCGMIRDFLEARKYTTDENFIILYKKIKNRSLTIEDKPLLSKYIKLYLKELEIGKSAVWEEQKKNPEECRKLLLKHRNEVFEVLTPIRPDSEDLEMKLQADDIKFDEELQKKAEQIRAVAKSNNTSISNAVTTSHFDMRNKKHAAVKLKLFSKKPFISNNKEDNFLIIMSEALNKFDEEDLAKIYEILLMSEYGESKLAKESCKEVIHNFFGRIVFQKNLMHAREHLMERLSALITFYKATGCLSIFCNINNSRLSRIYLEDLQIDEETLFAKFLNDDKLANQYFVDIDKEPDCSYKGTPMDCTSDEAIVGMSAFYTNRMSKQVQIYATLAYILDKKNVVERIFDNPDLEYEDLKYTDDDICTYMAMYKCFQKLMIKNYFQGLPPSKVLYEEEVHKNLFNILHKYKRVYEKYFPDKGFDFERDIDFVMMDVKLIQDMYELKSISIKSLLYTAITDKKKNIINWGFVPEDENSDGKFVLIGFDIKTLNMPLFVHMKREELIEFLQELTGNTKLRVYEGANDMYSYTIRQRVTAQVLYPLSKDEKKKLFKVQGTGALTDYYKHIRWLQQSNNPPLLSHVPGSRVYDFETDQIEKVNVDDLTNKKAAKKKTAGKKSKKTGEDR
ncbi:MAG: hypothetical protein IJH12_05885 [Clostridia bacterium]|nr:hypothetical protein [Clostridia bacterium]